MRGKKCKCSFMSIYELKQTKESRVKVKGECLGSTQLFFYVAMTSLLLQSLHWRHTVSEYGSQSQSNITPWILISEVHVPLHTLLESWKAMMDMWHTCISCLHLNSGPFFVQWQHFHNGFSESCFTKKSVLHSPLSEPKPTVRKNYLRWIGRMRKKPKEPRQQIKM